MQQNQSFIHYKKSFTIELHADPNKFSNNYIGYYLLCELFHQVQSKLYFSIINGLYFLSLSIFISLYIFVSLCSKSAIQSWHFLIQYLSWDSKQETEGVFATLAL